jgi:probable non-F420 flavinoid oxidoreductase
LLYPVTPGTRNGAVVIQLSYHISHEQFAPRQLLGLVVHAEEVGFDAAFSSDHIHPWSPQQGHSGFIWAWLGAALQATQRLTFAGITVPGNWRYHPAVIAQAIATLAEMFPGRLPWVAFGSGEALNECVVGAPWPSKATRNTRLKEAAGAIRALLAGERVSSDGEIRIANAQVWSLPPEAPRLIGAALSTETAEWVGDWADGLLTVGGNLERARSNVAAFRRRHPDKPMHAKIDLSWAPTEEQALQQAHAQWRVNVLEPAALGNLRTPEDMEHAASHIDPQKLRKSVLISSDLDQHIEWLRERAALGFQSLDLHNVGRNQQEFLDAFGRRVLPALRSASGAGS